MRRAAPAGGEVRIGRSCSRGRRRPADKVPHAVAWRCAGTCFQHSFADHQQEMTCPVCTWPLQSGGGAGPTARCRCRGPRSAQVGPVLSVCLGCSTESSCCAVCNRAQQRYCLNTSLLLV